MPDPKDNEKDGERRMDRSVDVVSQLGDLVREALSERGHNQAWLARQVDRSQGAISKLINGSWVQQGGVGRRLVKEVEVALGFPDDALVGLFDEASSGGAVGGEASVSARLDRRPPREILGGSLLSDSWFRRLRCYLVAPSDSRDDALFDDVRRALQQAAAEVVESKFPWDVYEGDEEDRIPSFDHECERATGCDLVILLVSQAHAEMCNHRRSVLEAFAQYSAEVNLPSLVYAAPGASAYANRAKLRKGIERNVVDRLYRFEPDRLAPLTYFRVVEAPSNSAVARDALGTVSSLTSASLVNLRAMSQVTWNDDQLEEREMLASEVWVYTPDFYYELEDSFWREVLVKTIRRGGVYRWLCPAAEEPAALRVIERVSRRTEKGVAEDALSFFGLAEHDLPWWPHAVIYDPEDDLRRVAFMYDLWDRAIPVSCNYNYRVPSDRAARLATAFKHLCTEERQLRPGRAS